MDKHIEEARKEIAKITKIPLDFLNIDVDKEVLELLFNHITNQDNKLKQIEEVVYRTIVNDKVTVEDMENIFNILKGE